MAAQAEPRTLADLPPGCLGCIAEIDASLSPAQAQRLRALGFRPGAVVERSRTAPLGDPTVYRVCDYDVCLRSAQARAIVLAA
jgi:ferrous iron transport protein A